MGRPTDRLRHFARLGTVIVGLAMAAVSQVTPGTTLRVWSIGSPHTDSIPPMSVPAALRQELAKRGIALEVQSFPARGFAALFAEAVRRNAAPDILAFDNFGVIEGIVVRGEKFDGLAEDPLLRRDLVRVTTAYDDLLGPERGWVYLVSSSANHTAARAFALRPADCRNSASAAEVQPDLAELVPRLATAYLEADAVTLQARADPEAITGFAVIRAPVRVGAAVVCGMWGNSKLAFVRILATYQGSDTIGRLPLMMVLRNSSGQWQLLVASRDPVTNGAFMTELRALTARLNTNAQLPIPAPAVGLWPADGLYPAPATGQRFGAFTWRSSESDEVVAEIGEFAYKDDARLIARRRMRPGSRDAISTGRLWTTRDWWRWRIWSITPNGDVAFSEVRSFYH